MNKEKLSAVSNSASEIASISSPVIQVNGINPSSLLGNLKLNLTQPECSSPSL